MSYEPAYLLSRQNGPKQMPGITDGPHSVSGNKHSTLPGYPPYRLNFVRLKGASLPHQRRHPRGAGYGVMKHCLPIEEKELSQHEVGIYSPQSHPSIVVTRDPRLSDLRKERGIPSTNQALGRHPGKEGQTTTTRQANVKVSRATTSLCLSHN